MSVYGPDVATRWPGRTAAELTRSWAGKRASPGAWGARVCRSPPPPPARSSASPDPGFRGGVGSAGQDDSDPWLESGVLRMDEWRSAGREGRFGRQGAAGWGGGGHVKSQTNTSAWPGAGGPHTWPEKRTFGEAGNRQTGWV